MKFFYSACICFALVATISAVAIGHGSIGLGGWVGQGVHGGHGGLSSSIGAVHVPIAAVPSRAIADAAAGAHAASLRHNNYAQQAVLNYQIEGGDWVHPIVSSGRHGKLNSWAAVGHNNPVGIY